MNRANFAIEHQREIERDPFGKIKPHLSDDITNDTRMPYGDRLRVMPDVAHTYGHSRYGGRETRNLSVGVKIRGGNESSSSSDSDSDLEGGAVPQMWADEGFGGDEPPRKELANGAQLDALFKRLGPKFADAASKAIYGEGKPFTKEQLTKIILDKNEVIADLEKNAYGGDWQEEMGMSKEEIEKMNKAWEDFLKTHTQGEGFWDDVRKGVVKYNERKKITPISEEDWKKQMEDFKAPTENWGADELDGGAAPKVEPKAPSGVAVAAEALQPVRTALQNGIGDLIYGKETDPKKQKKGLLGISEEGKEESKKKVMKNIVKPLVEGWTQLFDPDKAKADRDKRFLAESKKAAAKAGWLFELPDGEYTPSNFEHPEAKLIRQPRHYHRWVQKNAKYNTGYYIDDVDEGSIPYIKIPNPIKGLKPNYTIDELKKNKIPFFVPVTRVNATNDNEEVWRGGFEGEEIWVPQDIAKMVYEALNQYKMKLDEEKERAYYESLSEVEKREYRERKALEKDTGMTEAAKAKVAKDIADEEAKENPDTERLAKMKAAQERVRVKGVDNFWKGQTQGKQVSERIYKDKMAKDAAERQAADTQQQSDDMAAFEALSPAERTIQLEAYRKELQDSGFTDEQIEEQIGAVGGGFMDWLRGVFGKKSSENPDAFRTNPKSDAQKRQDERVRKNRQEQDRRNEAARGGMKGEKEERPSGLVEIVVNKHEPAPSRNPNEGKTLAQLQEEGEREYQEEKKRKAEKRKAAAAELELKKAKIEAARMASEAAKAAAEAVKAAVEEDEGDVEVEEYTYDGVLYLVEGGDVFNERRVFDPETSEELGVLGDPEWKGLAAVIKRSSGSGKLVGEGAIEFTLAKAGMSLFNPTRNMTMAGKQTFTPAYDAYGDTAAQGRLNAFNLSRSMYNQQQAIEIPGFDMIRDDTSLRFYIKDDENVVMVGIRGTDVKSWTDLYTWAVIGATQDFRMTTRFQDDLQKLLRFQKEYSQDEFYYVGVGSSLAGSIADRFLDMGLLSEAITYNPSIEKKYILDGNIENHRIFLDTDPLFILMGQYAPNTEIRVNAGKVNFYNPIKEKDFLIKSHSIYPVFNPAFEGGGMEGSGKTYTLEEWKAIFDAKLEKKRQQIEARAAKKKDTAKAKRARAKERRDERAEIPDLETPFRTSRVQKATPPKEREPEPEPDEEVETTQYKVDGKTVYVEDAREGLEFDSRGVWDDEDEQIGFLSDFREIAKKVLAKEKPKAPRKRADKKLAPPAPASARVELREELVAAQPRKPEGEFASEAEPLQLVVAEIERQPQRAYMTMLKSPQLTEADRRLLMSLQSSSMAPMRKVKMLARSGLARKLMEILGIDESAFQGQRARMRISDTMEKRTTGTKVREVALARVMDLFDKQEAGLIRFLAKKTDKKDGESISRFVDYVAKKFADNAIGTWVVVERMLSFGPSSWSCDGRGDIIGLTGMNDESNGGSFAASAMMFITEADEKNVTCAGFVRDEPRFGLDFGQRAEPKSFVNDEGQIEERPINPNQNFFFPEMTRACMDMVEKIDGVKSCDLYLRKAGMGYKRRREWSIRCEEVEPVQKRLKPEQKERIVKAEKEKAKQIGAKVGALVAEYKDLILKRGALMVERVEASLTPEQLAAVEAYEVKVSKPVVIAKKKKRLAEVEKKLREINRIDISAMRYMLLDDDERRREDEEIAQVRPLRAERDRLTREIAALEK